MLGLRLFPCPPNMVRRLGRGSGPLPTLGKRWTKALCLGALASGLVIGGFGPAVPSAVAASTILVDLGRASTYAVLSGASVGNTVSAAGTPHSRLPTTMLPSRAGAT